MDLKKRIRKRRGEANLGKRRVDSSLGSRDEDMPSAGWFAENS